MDEPAGIKFYEWLADNDLSSEKEEALFRVWNETDGTATKETAVSFISLQTKLQQQRKKKTFRLHLLRYSAVVALLIATGMLLVTMNRQPSEAGFVEYYCRSGQVETFLLPDSSTVWVNSGTLLLYPKSYGKNTRTIYLYGEAGFQVRKNTGLPFVVCAKNFEVTALGTEFDVSAYPDDPYFQDYIDNRKYPGAVGQASAEGSSAECQRAVCV
jgi:ferric-dicitrate binding protein FerR (iron transport regulator)